MRALVIELMDLEGGGPGGVRGKGRGRCVGDRAGVLVTGRVCW
jgi:hypothetical protein